MSEILTQITQNLKKLVAKMLKSQLKSRLEMALKLPFLAYSMVSYLLRITKGSWFYSMNLLPYFMYHLYLDV